MQPSLFDPEESDDPPCTYPEVEALTAYRYGCRCGRCRAAKSIWRHPSTICEVPQCTVPRVKGTRRCADHGKGLRRAPTRTVLVQAMCPRCSRPFGYYESTLWCLREDIKDFHRTVCPSCRSRVNRQVKKHHLSTPQAIELLFAERCSICRKPFTHFADVHGRVVVDHDHDCCPDTTSCGRCVRGFICSPCNAAIGAIDRMRREGIDVQAFLDYLDRPRGGEVG